VGVILHHGLKRMVEKQDNVYFYITLLNENYPMPGLKPGTEGQIIKGMYLLEEGARKGGPKGAAASPRVAPPAARKPRAEPTPFIAPPEESSVALFGGAARPAPASAPPAPGAPPKSVHLEPEEQEWRAFQHRLHIKVVGADAPRLWPTFDACP
jgi:hypothetical protein